MTTVVRVIFTIFTCLFGTSAIASHSYYTGFYGGVEGQYARMKFVKTQGMHIFNRESPGVNFFIGKKLNETVSLEGGYSYLKSSKTSTVEIMNQNYFPAPHVPLTYLSTTTFITKTILHELSLTALAFTQKLDAHPVQFFFGVGLNATRAKFHFRGVQWSYFKVYKNKHFYRSKVFAHTTIGAIYKLNESTWLRAGVVFKNSGKLGGVYEGGVATGLSDLPEIRTRNSLVYKVGFVWSF